MCTLAFLGYNFLSFQDTVAQRVLFAEIMCFRNTLCRRHDKTNMIVETSDSKSFKVEVTFLNDVNSKDIQMWKITVYTQLRHWFSMWYLNGGP